MKLSEGAAWYYIIKDLEGQPVTIKETADKWRMAKGTVGKHIKRITEDTDPMIITLLKERLKE